MFAVQKKSFIISAVSAISAVKVKDFKLDRYSTTEHRRKYFISSYGARAQTKVRKMLIWFVGDFLPMLV
jgi:hypothetical protein